VKKSGLLRRYEVFTHNGTQGTGLDPVDFARRVEQLGAGEIVVNSIDRDGEMKGYDVELISRVREAISLPMTVLGGAGTLKDIEDLIRTFGIIGAAAGSLFVFKGKYRAVLINYPSCVERNKIYIS
jgi:cyclase